MALKLFRDLKFRFAQLTLFINFFVKAIIIASYITRMQNFERFSFLKEKFGKT